jgi:hypothetical protein
MRCPSNTGLGHEWLTIDDKAIVNHINGLHSDDSSACILFVSICIMYEDVVNSKNITLLPERGKKERASESERERERQDYAREREKREREERERERERETATGGDRERKRVGPIDKNLLSIINTILMDKLLIESFGYQLS